MVNNPATLLGDIDFRRLNSKDFKEDSVREVIILPILHYLGYKNNDIVRSKSLMHPFLTIGSQKRKVTLIPDYVLKVKDNYAWVLDAKAPDEEITHGDNVEQVYSYATHPEIRAKYFALCNGKQFTLFKQDNSKPILNFKTSEISSYLEVLQYYLSTNSFQTGKNFSYDNFRPIKPDEKFDYLNRPLLDEIIARKQSAKRHFGVHGYFTKQAWNVVSEYIKHFSQPGDLVFDPFGGSGVTAIEALMLDRKAIHIDLNPMSVFIVNSLVAPVKLSELIAAFERVKEAYLKYEPKTKLEIKHSLGKYHYPKGFVLPKGSDVAVIEELFTEEQLSKLAFLKHLIKKEKEENIRNSLLLAFSSSVNKFNKTFHYTKSEGGGDSGPFRYYRYRIAPSPGKLELMNIFETKFQKIFSAKKEIESKINQSTIKNIKILKGTATNLDWIKNESVDYIYTDPPYGKKIPYLDLSVMWNAWLDLKVTKKDYEEEAIEGGEHHKNKDEYNDLIAKSIKEMYRVLKFDRWMSFVFAHKDPAFWHLIIDTAEEAGFEYIGAVPQKNGQSSFKKRQHPFTVLSGQLIINFKKVHSPRTILKVNLGVDTVHIVIETIEGVIAKNNGATLEQINDELIVKGLEYGFLDLLKKEYSDLTPLLLAHFDYNDETSLFTIPKNKKFKTNIDDRLRIKYYLFSYLTRMEAQKKSPKFDDIVTFIMPLLRNGHTPENQTILKVLEDIAEHSGEGRWRLKHSDQTSLFF
jgi:16S rRNA G966 N2-methylase RsmD